MYLVKIHKQEQNTVNLLIQTWHQFKRQIEPQLSTKLRDQIRNHLGGEILYTIKDQLLLRKDL